MRLAEASVVAVKRAQLLFFMTPEHDLATFLTTHLGVATYPPYVVRRTRPVFPDRATFLEYEAVRRRRHLSTRGGEGRLLREPTGFALAQMRLKADAVDAALGGGDGGGGGRWFLGDKEKAWELVQPHLKDLDGLGATGPPDIDARRVTTEDLRPFERNVERRGEAEA